MTCFQIHNKEKFKMKIRPTNKKLTAKLYVKPEKEEIILTVKKPYRDRFIVLDACENDQNIKSGDIIFCSSFDVIEYQIDSELIYVIPIDEVMGVLE